MDNELIFYPNKILLTPSELVTKFDEELRQLVDKLATLMYKYEGAGLSACQIGVNKRVFVCELGAKHLTIVINPSIQLEGETRKTVEGCLSIPEVKARLKCRHSTVTLNAQDIEGKPFTQLLVVRDAVIVQHEFDHMNGVTLFQRIDPIQRKMSLRRYHGSRS
jgi:peptide deformylase